jgi:AraC-like DNA-binding protein
VLRDGKRVRALSPVKRRRQFPHRRALRQAVRRDVCNLFTFKLAQHFMERGLSLNLAATRLGISPSTLCALRKIYDQGGYSVVAPHLKDVFPEALEFDLGMFLTI